MMFSLSPPLAQHIGYFSSVDCTSKLQDVQAIDYFFACNAIAQRYDANAKHIFFTNKQALQQIFHVLIALSCAQRQGHGCLDLSAISSQSLWVDKGQQEEQGAQEQLDKAIKPGFTFLGSTELETIIQMFLDIFASRKDLHWAKPYLYSARYYQYEKEIAEYFIVQQKLQVQAGSPQFSALQECATQLWPHLFDLGSQSQIDWQLLSVANGLLAKASIISGGAGTGKTYTVARLLLSWLYTQTAEKGGQVKLLLAAPTGKAAQRLNESILEEFKKVKSTPDIANLVEQLSPMIEAQTLHRLLGLGMFGIQPRYNEYQPVDCDLLVVDEASMIDVAMMAKLLRALPKHAKLILVGDANQLPSVESGGLLKDLVNQADWTNANIDSVYSAAHKNNLLSLFPFLSQKNAIGQSNSGLDTNCNYHYDHVTFLQRSMRSEGVIKTFADTILLGDPARLHRFLTENTCQIDLPTEANEVASSNATQPQLSFNLALTSKESDISWYQNAYTQLGNLKPTLIASIAQKYVALFQSENAFNALLILEQYRLLSPTKKGRLGTNALNSAIEMQLKKQFSHIQVGKLYKGMPIMVVENNYRLGLFNGDIGIIWNNKAGQLVACFAHSKGDDVKEFGLNVLPKFELVFAMTIHKTQGSEFTAVDIVLPNQLPRVSNAFENQHLSKEILYTGVTRAKKRIGIIASAQTIKDAVMNTSKRFSGLKRQINQ